MVNTWICYGDNIADHLARLLVCCIDHSQLLCKVHGFASLGSQGRSNGRTSASFACWDQELDHLGDGGSATGTFLRH